MFQDFASELQKKDEALELFYPDKLKLIDSLEYPGCTGIAGDCTIEGFAFQMSIAQEAVPGW